MQFRNQSTPEELNSQFKRLGSTPEFAAYRSHLINQRENAIAKICFDEKVKTDTNLLLQEVGYLAAFTTIIEDIMAHYTGAGIDAEDVIPLKRISKASKTGKKKPVSEANNSDSQVNKE